MKTLVTILLCVGLGRAAQIGHKDYSGNAVRFFSGEDNKAARAEMTPSPDCVEGDMMLTDEQREVYLAMRETNAENRERVRRDANAAFHTWPNKTFVYRYQDDLSLLTIELFENAIEMYRESTVIQFVRALDGYSGSITPLLVAAGLRGCTSTVGYSGGGMKINLQPDTCDHLGTILHELGHALYRFHEHTREDRDEYLTVIEANIRQGYEHNFQVVQRPVIAKYDLQSVMHYGPEAFSIDGISETLAPKRNKDRYKMGLQRELTRLDIFTINVLYGAFDNCPVDILWERCQRGGVPSKHCTCLCLPAFEGPYCEIYVPPTSCSTHHTDSVGVIHSPNWPNRYPSNTHCCHVIECEEGTIQLNFEKFVIEGYGCWFDNMKVAFGDLTTEMYPDQYCDKYLNNEILTSETSVAILDFYSDYIYQYQGYEINYSCLAMI